MSDGVAWSTDHINNSDSDLESNSPSKYTPYSTYSSNSSRNNHPAINPSVFNPSQTNPNSSHLPSTSSNYGLTLNAQTSSISVAASNSTNKTPGIDLIVIKFNCICFHLNMLLKKLF